MDLALSRDADLRRSSARSRLEIWESSEISSAWPLRRRVSQRVSSSTCQRTRPHSL